VVHHGLDYLSGIYFIIFQLFNRHVRKTINKLTLMSYGNIFQVYYCSKTPCLILNVLTSECIK